MTNYKRYLTLSVIILSLVWLTAGLLGCNSGATLVIEPANETTPTVETAAAAATTTPTPAVATPTEVLVVQVTPSVTLTPTATTRPTATPSPSPSPTNTPPAIPKGIINADGVNMRSGPDLGYAITGRGALNQIVEIVGRNEEISWWQVCCAINQDEPSWISSQFITTTLTLSETADLVEISDGPTALTGVVKGGEINLRMGPDTEYPLAGEISAGSEVTIVGRSADGNWFQLRNPLNTITDAWIYKPYVLTSFNPDEAETLLPLVEAPPIEAVNAELALVQPTSYTLTVSGRITEDLINLRSGPDTSYDLVGTVTRDDVVEIVGQTPDGEWWHLCCISDRIQQAWISAEFVAVEPSQDVADIPIVFVNNPETPEAEATPAQTVAESTPTAATAAATEAPAAVEAEPTAPAAAPAQEEASVGVSPENALPPTGSYPPPGDTNPLTGLPLDAAKIGLRPVIVCINNDPQARPQYGVSQADVMYEYFMESYFITRFTGIFYGEDVERIGPVRSARLVNYYLGGLYNAPLFCSGASDQVRYILKNEAPFPYLDIDLDDPAQTRYTRLIGTDYRTRFHTDTEGLRAWLRDWDAEQAANIRGFTFGAAVDGGVPANTINIPYSSGTSSDVSYVYSTAAETYRRYLGGQAYNDPGNGAPVAVENVVVQYVPHIDTDIIEDSLGSQSIRLDLFGEGTALVFRDGQAYEGTWRSSQQGDTPRFFTTDGREINLKPGKTWISVVPENMTITYQ